MKLKSRARRSVMQRRPKFNKTMDDLGNAILAQAQELFEKSNSLDTAVREVVHDGLAYIVHAAYDTIACANCISDVDFGPYIQAKTYEWFREHGFVEWFCVGASTLFQTTPQCFFRYHVEKKKNATVFKREKVG